MISPAGQVHVKTFACEVIAIPFVVDQIHQVTQKKLSARQVVKRQNNMALALVLPKIDDNNQSLLIGSFPGKGEKVLVGRVAFPTRPAIEQAPKAVAEF